MLRTRPGGAVELLKRQRRRSGSTTRPSRRGCARRACSHIHFAVGEGDGRKGGDGARAHHAPPAAHNVTQEGASSSRLGDDAVVVAIETRHRIMHVFPFIIVAVEAVAGEPGSCRHNNKLIGSRPSVSCFCNELLLSNSSAPAGCRRAIWAQTGTSNCTQHYMNIIDLENV